MGSIANGQQNDGTEAATRAALQAQAEREVLAESLLAREEAESGRAFDSSFRAESLRKLASRPLAELEAIQSQGTGIGTSAYGDSAADLVFTPVTPCRIVDTRLAGGAIAAGGTRSFLVAAGNYSSQGGSSTTCGIPFGPTTAAVLNFVAINPAGAGNLRVTPFATAMPTASIVNYALPGTGLNLANGLVVKICNPATTSCGFDITVQADVNAVQLVVDVMGYFQKLPTAGRAYAFVPTRAPSPAFGAAKTKGFSAISSPGTGDYCLTPNPPIDPNTTPWFVTVDWSNSLGSDLLAFTRQGFGCALQQRRLPGVRALTSGVRAAPEGCRPDGTFSESSRSRPARGGCWLVSPVACRRACRSGRPPPGPGSRCSPSSDRGRS
jgi:hypothetical protein